MSDARTGIQESGPGQSAEARRPDEEHQVQAAVREIVDSLEKGISPSLVDSLVGLVLWVPISLFIAVVVTWLVVGHEVGGGVAIFFVVLVVVLVLPVLVCLARGGVAPADWFGQDTLSRSAARRFAKRFPEGSPERPLAIRMLSETNTPHKAGQKLLQALPAAEKPTPPPGTLAGSVVGLILWWALVMLGVPIGNRLKVWGIDETIQLLVQEAFFGAGLGVFLACRSRPGLKAALLWIPAYAIGCALFTSLGTTIRRNYGLWPALAYFAGLVLAFYLAVKVFSRYWRRTASPDQQAAASSPHE
jgi:hypothetical protein